jgi:outer membrane protein
MNTALLALALAAGPTLTIDQALILAKQNPQIAQAQGALMQAQGQIGVARSGFLPSASASASVFGTTLNPGLQPSDTVYALYGSSVTLNQTLWDFGRTLGAYQAARDVERSARFNVENTWQQVELNVRTAYYVVLATQALVNVAQQTV